MILHEMRMARNISHHLPLWSQIRIGLLLTLPMLLIINGVIWSAYSMLLDQQREQWRQQAEIGLDAALVTLNTIRNDLHGDLFLLAASPVFKAVLDNPTVERVDQLAAEWEIVAAIKRRYDQIRWLDNNGMERLRINLSSEGAIRVPDNQLQDKSGRYYFQEAMTLKVGQVYASPIDLNVEHGEIEQPYRPMLRLALPVSNSRGELSGLLLVNVPADFIFDDLARHAGLAQSHLLMLDPQGYYLRGFSEEQEWGFMFSRQEETDYRFDKTYPLIWQKVVQQGVGKVDASQGRFLFRTFRYGTEGYGHHYFLLAAALLEDMEYSQVVQKQLWLSVSFVLSLAQLLFSLFLAHYLVRCRTGCNVSSGC
jgi:hypothetical protein